MWPFKKKLKIGSEFHPSAPTGMLDGQYKIEHAFNLEGVDYYHIQDAFKLPTGRGLCTLMFYEEMNQRTTRDYLKDHVRANEILFSDPKKINIGALVLINHNLKERLDLAVFPDHVYKLASVMFFDKTEHPYEYNVKYNQEKIEKWKNTPGVLGFFLRTPLKDLINFSQLPEPNAEQFFQVSEMIDELHHKDLQDVLSKSP